MSSGTSRVSDRYDHRPLSSVPISTLPTLPPSNANNSNNPNSVLAPVLAPPPLGVGAIIPGGVGNGSLHPSAQRLGDLLEFVRSEFEQVTNESGALRGQREEYEAMSEYMFPIWLAGVAWASGLVRRVAFVWVPACLDGCARECSTPQGGVRHGIQDDNMRLRRELESRPHGSISSSSGIPSSQNPSQSQLQNQPRPSLPPINPGMGGSSAPGGGRPSSSHSHHNAPQVGHGPSNLFGGGTSLPGGGGGNERANSAMPDGGNLSSNSNPYPIPGGYTNGRVRPGDNEMGEQPNKRMRGMDDEERGGTMTSSMGKQKGE
ncbi:hypothetical protein P7C70_g8017, partial [Phenoliferia sp. Uapishka_3]